MRTCLRFALVAIVTAALAAAADPALLKLVMPEARVISGFNVSQVMASPLGQFLLSQLPPDAADFQKFVTMTGFDPRRDLQEVLIAASASPRPERTGLVLVRGSLDTSRVIQLAKQHGAGIHNYKGVTILTLNGKHTSPAKPGGNGEGWFALLDNSTAALGDAASVRGAIDRRSSGSSLDARLTAKVHELSSLYDFWGVSTIPATEWAGTVPDEKLGGAMKGDIFRAIEETSGGVRFGTDIEIAGEAVTRSDKDATALADVVRFLTGLVQMNAQDPKVAGVSRFLQSMELTTSGNTMKLSLRIPEAEIEKLILTAKEQQKSAGESPAVRRSRRARRAAAQPEAPAGRNSSDVIIHSSPKEMGTVVIKQ
jgi:hypothetical protein